MHTQDTAYGPPLGAARTSSTPSTYFSDIESLKGAAQVILANCLELEREIQRIETERSGWVRLMREHDSVEESA